MKTDSRKNTVRSIRLVRTGSALRFQDSWGNDVCIRTEKLQEFLVPYLNENKGVDYYFDLLGLTANQMAFLGKILKNWKADHPESRITVGSSLRRRAPSSAAVSS